MMNSGRARPQIAVVGLGSRVGNLIANAAAKGFSFEVCAVADPHPEAARIGRLPAPPAGIREFPSLEALMTSGLPMDAIVIGSRCDLHSHLACQAAALQIPVFLEKPVGIDREQLSALQAAYAGQEHRVVVSFPLRVSPLFQSVQEIVSSGRLGTINQIQAVNYVPYGGVYFADWYRDHQVTGGMWLQKATHDFDYLGLLASSEPVRIYASETRMVFGGSMPANLRCSQCPQQGTCLESPLNLKLHGDAGGMGDGDHWCVFSEDIQHHDAASAIVTYANGLNVSYTQNFITRRPAGRRGAVITGYLGTLEFDWRTESITVHDHKRSRTDHIEVKTSTGHNGGDMVLWKNFLDVIEGRCAADPDLHDGIHSAALCMSARECCETGIPQMISGNLRGARRSTRPRSHAGVA